MIEYSYDLDFDKYKLFKILILWLCLFIDFGNFWIFLGSLAVLKWSAFFCSIGIFLLLLIIRIFSTFLEFKITFTMIENKLRVIKKQAYLVKEVLSINFEEILSIEKYCAANKYCDKTLDKKWQILAKRYSYTCDFDLYVLELKNEKKVLLALDDFIFANINQSLQK